MKKMKVYTNKNVKQNGDVESGGSDKNITIYISTSSNSRCFQRLKIIIYIQLIILIAFLTLTGFISFGGLALFSSDPVPQPAERFHKPDAFARISDIANVTHDPIISTTAVENNDAADRAKIENILKPKSELDEIQFGINDFNEALEDFHHQVVGTLDDLVGNNDSNDNDKSSTFLNILTDRDNVEQLFSPHESDWLPPILVNTDNAPETETPITIFITNSDLKEFSEFEKSERNEDPWVSLTDILGKQSDLNLGLGFSSRHSGEGMNDVSTTEGDFETTLLDFLMKYGQGEIDNSGEKHDKSEDSNEKSIGITEKSQETNETTEVTHEQTDETDEKSLPNLDESYEKMDDDQWFKWSMTETAEDNPEIPKYSNWWEGMFLSNDGDGTDVEDTTGEADDMIQKVPGNGFELYTSTESSDYPLESDYYSYEDDDNDSLTTMLSSLLDDLNADSRDKDEKMVAMTNDQLTSAHQPADKEAELVSGLKTSDEEPCNPETEVYVALSTAFPDWNNKCIDRELYDKATLDEFLRDIERLHG